jgi:alpha-mannosidase
MNNHWGVNYRPYQEGPVTFRFLLRPHGSYDAAAASRFAISASQPLLPVRASGAKPLSTPRLTLDSPDVIVTALKPSNDKQALILRLWNTGSRDTSTAIHWSAPAPRRVTLSNTAEETLDKIDGPIAIPAQGLVTLRAELQ